MKNVIIYSSLTGNTRAVAEAIIEVMPEGTRIYSINEAPESDDFDLLALGFWVSKSGPDQRMAAYMKGVRGKNVCLFGTMAGYPDSEYGERVRRNAEALLEGNRVLGTFLCQGRIAQKRFDTYMSGELVSKKHPMTAERKARLIEASHHPNEEDFAKARSAFKDFLQKVKK